MTCTYSVFAVPRSSRKPSHVLYRNLSFYLAACKLVRGALRTLAMRRSSACSHACGRHPVSTSLQLLTSHEAGSKHVMFCPPIFPCPHVRQVLWRTWRGAACPCLLREAVVTRWHWSSAKQRSVSFSSSCASAKACGAKLGSLDADSLQHHTKWRTNSRASAHTENSRDKL